MSTFYPTATKPSEKKNLSTRIEHLKFISRHTSVKRLSITGFRFHMVVAHIVWKFPFYHIRVRDLQWFHQMDDSYKKYSTSTERDFIEFLVIIFWYSRDFSLSILMILFSNDYNCEYIEECSHYVYDDHLKSDIYTCVFRDDLNVKQAHWFMIMTETTS